MKKSFILSLVSLLVFVLQAGAQSDITPTVFENLQGELVLSDPLSGKRYHKASPISLKKGEAVLFTMKSSAFKPYILFGTNQATMVMGNLNESGTESKATFHAPADTSFFVIFTSMEENKTGKFSYGYKLLKAEQVSAINNAKKNPVNQFTPGKLGKQLLELLDYTKEEFKSIKGEIINTKKSESDFADRVEITNNYKTNYSLEGSIENTIEELYVNEKYMVNPNLKFIALYGKDLSKQGGEDLYAKLLSRAKAQLNDGYEFKEDINDIGSGFYIKTMEIKPVGDRKHIISLIITFHPGIKGWELVSHDKSEVKITVEEFHL
jgi:hypothetical protein